MTLSYDCEQALQRLDELRRGELSPEETAALEQHLEACRRCLCIERYERAFVERMQATRLLIRCPEDLRDKVRKQCAEGRRDG